MRWKTIHFKIITVPAFVVPHVTMPRDVGHVLYFTVKPKLDTVYVPEFSLPFQWRRLPYTSTLRCVFSCSHVGPSHTAGTETRNVETIPAVPRLCSLLLSGLLTRLNLAGKWERNAHRQTATVCRVQLFMKKQPLFAVTSSSWRNSHCLPWPSLHEETATVCRNHLFMKKQLLFAVTISSWRNSYCLP